MGDEEKENTGGAEAVAPGLQMQQLCRFYALGRRCNFGGKCKFLHQRDATKMNQNKPDRRPELENREETRSRPSEGAKSAAATDSRSGGVAARTERARRRPCLYFMSGFCAMEDRCRFWHPAQFPPVEERSVEAPANRGCVRRPAARPGVTPQEAKLSELTEDLTKQLRDTEIRQLVKRFPKDQLIIQEQSDGLVTFYRATVEATDPEWPFDLKEVDILVSFPEKYPLEIFTFGVPEDQDLPSLMGRHVQQASTDWLRAKHATNQLMGKVELLLRPFLRWLDRSLERLFTEGARQLKRTIECERAGLQFIPYRELQATLSETLQEAAVSLPEEVEEVEEVEEEEEEDDDDDDEEDDDDDDEEEEARRLVQNIKISEPRRGTEVKLLGLSLGDNTATVVATRVTVCLQCSRCKVTADLTLSGRTSCEVQCERCSSRISAAFRPGMLHRYSHVLGFLDLHNAAACDLVLHDTQLAVGCMSCSKEVPLQNLCYGQTKEFNCEHCHSKLSILVDSTTFLFIPPRANKPGLNVSAQNHQRKLRDPAVQKGKPLPEEGACRHFRQSQRWMRFPCCGRAYPCGVCHDKEQDHPMELATRMICGHCATEQPYNNGKPCVGCGGLMTRGAHSSHWEGGLGCRNKMKMNRNDRQKYSNTNKTVSRKAANEKKK